MPQVSIILTCCNDAANVGQSIRSVIDQTFEDWELIIVDDGSTDASIDNINSFKDARIQVMSQKNQGVIVARNTAIASCGGLYFIPLDADDFLEPTFVEKTLEAIKNRPKVGIVGTYARFLYPDGSTSIWKEHHLELKDFLLQTRMVSCSLFRRECWEQTGGYDPIMKKGYEDWELYISILARGWQAIKIEEPLFTYRQKSANSRNKNALEKDLYLKMLIFKKHENLYKANASHLFEQYHLEKINAHKEISKIQLSESFKLGHKLITFAKKFKLKRND